MTDGWKYQLRVYLDDALAERAIHDDDVPELKPLRDLMHKHDARMVSQWRAFQDYVAETEAAGQETPLSKWTKATLADPAMRARHLGAFALRVADQEVYGAGPADALEAELGPLVGGEIVRRMSRHDTNPANNIPVPAQYRG